MWWEQKYVESNAAELQIQTDDISSFTIDYSFLLSQY